MIYVVVILGFLVTIGAIHALTMALNEQTKQYGEGLKKLMEGLRGIEKIAHEDVVSNVNPMTVPFPVQDRTEPEKDSVRVYAFGCFDRVSGENQLIMTIAKDIRGAVVNMEQILFRQGKDPTKYNIYMQNHIDFKVSLHGDKQKESTGTKSTIDQFVYNLKYVSDNFTESADEKKIIGGIISRIEKEHDGRSRSNT